MFLVYACGFTKTLFFQPIAVAATQNQILMPIASQQVRQQTSPAPSPQQHYQMQQQAAQGSPVSQLVQLSHMSAQFVRQNSGGFKFI